MLLIIATATFSQQTETSPVLTKQDYLKKSKKQKTAAFILLGSGIGMTIGGLAINLGQPWDINLSWNSQPTSVNSNNGEKGMWLFYLGVGATLTSIPFFISAHKIKKKGMSLSFKNETAPQIYKSGFVNCPIPSITLKISL